MLFTQAFNKLFGTSLSLNTQLNYNIELTIMCTKNNGITSQKYSF